MVLVVDQDEFITRLRIGEADAAGITGVTAVGDLSHRALRGKLGV